MSKNELIAFAVVFAIALILNIRCTFLPNNLMWLLNILASIVCAYRLFTILFRLKYENNS